MKISVVIPVYNVQSYLVQCINSVVKQSYQNIEIILIDEENIDNVLMTYRSTKKGK